MAQRISYVRILRGAVDGDDEDEVVMESEKCGGSGNHTYPWALTSSTDFFFEEGLALSDIVVNIGVVVVVVLKALKS